MALAWASAVNRALTLPTQGNRMERGIDRASHAQAQGAEIGRMRQAHPSVNAATLAGLATAMLAVHGFDRHGKQIPPSKPTAPRVSKPRASTRPQAKPKAKPVPVTVTRNLVDDAWLAVFMQATHDDNNRRRKATLRLNAGAF